MPRFQRPIIQSDKHEITWSNLAQNASVTQPITLSTAVQPSAKNTLTEVAIGSKIYGIYLEFHFAAETITNAKVIHWKVQVIPPAMTVSIANSYYQLDRAYVIQRGMEMLPKDVGTVFKRIIFVRIPKIYQRQKEGQVISFRYQSSSTETINACGIAIYKEKK